MTKDEFRNWKQRPGTDGGRLGGAAERCRSGLSRRTASRGDCFAPRFAGLAMTGKNLVLKA